MALLARGEGAYVWDDAGTTLPRLPRRHRRELARARAPGLRRRDRDAGGDARARLQLLRDRAAARARRAAQAPRRRGRRGRVYFGNSGAEANEAAFKLARLHGGTERPRILALTDAFHGRTMGTLALTGKPYMREPFLPMTPGRRAHRLDDRGARGRDRRSRRRALRRADQGRGRASSSCPRATSRRRARSPSSTARC